MEKIGLKSISELLGMNFFIPSYQRGYRWTKQQVKDLLDDIQEFVDTKERGADKMQETFYCIQPLVVKRALPNNTDFIERLQNIEDGCDLLQKTESIISEFTKWEVIDGQQRLTTVYILLSYLGKTDYYQIEYETRSDSKSFLGNIDIETKEPNIDYFHMIEAKKQIEEWFSKWKEDEEREAAKNAFSRNLLDNVKFIWYESKDEKPVKVFTRLNIGKISLTNAELVKALFLNRSNFQGNDYQKTRLHQQEIASEWDAIEYALQNDEFWLFLNSVNYDKPTRIDLIFDLICKENMLGHSSDEIGEDEYKTFRYFYSWFKSDKEDKQIIKCWKKVKQIFQILQEWFDDLELYHYIGYLLSDVNGQSISKCTISDLIKEWGKTSTKREFIDNSLFDRIKQAITSCENLDKQYEESGSPKTQCRPILLLHNVQTVINQNNSIKEGKYKLSVFYKFPFHLFKKEKWDVEHIDSNTENNLESKTDQVEWLKYSYDFVDKDTQEQIKQLIESEKYEERDFQHLLTHITTIKEGMIKRLSDSEKNQIWNFVLLDASTNRSYRNSIFPSKRRTLIGKDQGKKTIIKDFTTEEVDGAIAFIPPCTKNAFLKYYSHSTNNLREWNEDDAKAYKKNIESVLSKFL